MKCRVLSWNRQGGSSEELAQSQEGWKAGRREGTEALGWENQREECGLLRRWAGGEQVNEGAVVGNKDRLGQVIKGQTCRLKGMAAPVSG